MLSSTGSFGTWDVWWHHKTSPRRRLPPWVGVPNQNIELYADEYKRELIEMRALRKYWGQMFCLVLLQKFQDVLMFWWNSKIFSRTFSYQKKETLWIIDKNPSHGNHFVWYNKKLALLKTCALANQRTASSVRFWQTRLGTERSGRANYYHRGYRKKSSMTHAPK